MSFDTRSKNRNKKLKDFSVDSNDTIPSLVTSTAEIDVNKLKDTVKMITEEKIESCNKQFSHAADSNSTDEPKIPITIITGFLGSGKSTMLNYITNIVNTSNLKIAVIMNEFGDTLDIEKSITIYNKEQSSSKDENNSVEWLDLGNGCICCSVKDVGVKAIEDLVKRQKNNIDYIILETSGLAEPGNIAKMFWLDDGLMTNIKLDGIITVLDGSNIEAILDNQTKNDIAIRQIAIADKIVLNKTDKIDAEKLPLLLKKLHTINNSSETIETSFGRLEDLKQILFLNGYSNFTDFSDKLETENVSNHSDQGIQTVKIDFPVLTTVEQFDALREYLQKLHWQNFGYNYASEGGNDTTADQYGEIMRSKGLIISDGFDPFTKKERNGLDYKVLQGVRDTFDIMDTAATPLESMAAGKLVLIGKDLNEDQVRKELQSLLKYNCDDTAGSKECNHIHTDFCRH